MGLGFVGTGTIAAAIVRGLGQSGWSEPILVSPRNAGLAAALTAEWPFVHVAASNQDVVDQCETVFLAVRPQVAEGVLSELVFRTGQDLVSLIGTFSLARLAGLVGPGPRLSRAIPLPFVEQRIGATPVHPQASVATAIFDRLGRSMPIADETQLNLILAASATMGAFYQQQASIAQWLEQRGVAPDMARTYLGDLVSGLAASADHRRDTAFVHLVDEFSTPGGLNEQVHRHLAQAGVPDILGDALDAVLQRVARDSA